MSSQKALKLWQWLVETRTGNKVVYIASSKSFGPKRFDRRLKKVERKYIQEQKLNQSRCYNQNMLTEWTRTWQSTGLMSE